MKKVYLVFLLMFLCVTTCHAAKMNAYTEDTTPTRDDIVNTMDDPAGTQTTKKVTIANLLTAGQLGDLSDVGTATHTAGYILVGDGTQFQGVAMSGDVSLTGSGVTNISSIDNQVTVQSLVSTGTGTTILNSSKGATSDFIVHGDTTDNLFIVDVSMDTITMNGELDIVTTLNPGIQPHGETADPCSTESEGWLFYNSTGHYWCYCNNSNVDVKLTDNTTACF